MKYLVALVIVVGLLAVLRAQRRRQRGRPTASRRTASPQVRPPQRMSRCAACGVHLPTDEALAAGDEVFCNEEHRRLHRPTGRG